MDTKLLQNSTSSLLKFLQPYRLYVKLCSLKFRCMKALPMYFTLKFINILNCILPMFILLYFDYTTGCNFTIVLLLRSDYTFRPTWNLLLCFPFQIHYFKPSPLYRSLPLVTAIYVVSKTNGRGEPRLLASTL